MSQTQVKKIVINLEQLYDLFGAPNATACDILYSILVKYIEDADRTISRIMILLNPDLQNGYEIVSLYHTEDPLIDEVENIIEKEDEIDVALDEVQKYLKTEYIIELNDGYEKCVAFT